MKIFLLRGIAEGLTGHSSVFAKNLKDVYKKFPVLRETKNKLNVKNNTISGFCPCDG